MELWREKATEDCWLHTHLPHLLLDQEEDKRDMNELDLSHIVLKMKTKYLPKHTSLLSLLATMTHKLWSAVLYDHVCLATGPKLHLIGSIFVQEKKRQGFWCYKFSDTDFLTYIWHITRDKWTINTGTWDWNCQNMFFIFISYAETLRLKLTGPR